MFYLGEKDGTLYRWSEAQNKAALDRVRIRSNKAIRDIIIEEFPEHHPLVINIKEQLRTGKEEI